MRWTHVLAVGAVTSIGLVAACSAPAGNTGTGSAPTGNTTQGSGKIDTASAALDPTAKGPAPEVAGAKKGGTLTVAYATSPSNMDPSAQF